MRRALLLFALLLSATPAQAERVQQASAAYAVFQDDISAIAAARAGAPSDIDDVLERASRHEPAALSRGFIAYGALSAAQSRAFVDGVRSRVRAANRAAVIRQLRADMGYARRRPPGSAEAVRIILDMAAGDSGRLSRVAASYDDYGRALGGTALHHNETERNARDARLRELSRTTPALPQRIAPMLRIAPASASPLSNVRALGGRQFWDGISGAPSDAAASPPPWRERHCDAVDRMLTLAALLIVEADDAETSRVDALLNDSETQQCVRMAQLTFRQCVSVAYGSDEDALCLARHALRQQSACLASFAQAP